MIRRTSRTARKHYWCEGYRCVRYRITPGERYVELTASPDHEDLGNVGWWRVRICERCAEVVS